MTEPMNAEAVAIEWPREIWAKERTEFDVTGEHVFSVHATVARWEDGSEGEFHRYVDGDTMDSLKRYHDTMIADLRAENATLRAPEAAALERVRVLEAALQEIADEKFYPMGIGIEPTPTREAKMAAKALTPTTDKEPKT